MLLSETVPQKRHFPSRLYSIVSRILPPDDVSLDDIRSETLNSSEVDLDEFGSVASSSSMFSMSYISSTTRPIEGLSLENSSMHSIANFVILSRPDFLSPQSTQLSASSPRSLPCLPRL